MLKYKNKLLTPLDAHRLTAVSLLLSNRSSASWREEWQTSNNYKNNKNISDFMVSLLLLLGEYQTLTTGIQQNKDKLKKGGNGAAW